MREMVRSRKVRSASARAHCTSTSSSSISSTSATSVTSTPSLFSLLALLSHCAWSVSCLSTE